MDILIKLDPETLSVLTRLCDTLATEKKTTKKTTATPVAEAPTPVAEAPTPVAEPLPTAQPATEMPVAPFDAADAPFDVGISADTYTEPSVAIQAISRAGAQLVQAGKLNEVRQLMETFGIKNLQELRVSSYAEFITALRALGANL